MFGYVTVYKPELKIKEYEAYKGVYCTLCKEMGKEYGVLSRFLLSYDSTFYIIYKLGLRNEDVTATKSRCTFNPCKKCVKISTESDIYKLAGAITVILAYFKLMDNINDSSFFKKLLLYFIYPYFAFLKNKAKKKYPDIFEKIGDGMNEQLVVEKEKSSLDRSADPSAKMLGYLFAYDECDEISYKLGYQLGRTVYFLDAFDDYKKDIKTGSYNPFANSENLIDDATLTVRLSIGELIAERNKLKLNQFSNVIDNILYDGLEYQFERITEKYRGEKVE